MTLASQLSWFLHPADLIPQDTDREDLICIRILGRGKK